MNAVLIGVAIFVAALVLWLVLQSSQGQKKNAVLESQLSELRRELQTIAADHCGEPGAKRGKGGRDRAERYTAPRQRLQGAPGWRKGFRNYFGAVSNSCPR